MILPPSVLLSATPATLSTLLPANASSFSTLLLLQYYLVHYLCDRPLVQNGLYTLYYVLERLEEHAMAPRRLRTWCGHLRGEVRACLDSKAAGGSVRVVLEMEEREEIVTKRVMRVDSGCPIAMPASVSMAPVSQQQEHPHAHSHSLSHHPTTQWLPERQSQSQHQGHKQHVHY